MIMVETDLSDESDIVSQSEVVDYTDDCEVASENCPGKIVFFNTNTRIILLLVVSTNAAHTFLGHDEEQNSAEIDSVANEDNFIDSEIFDENLLDSTQPSNIALVVKVEAPCHQIEANEYSCAYEQNSSESVDSLHVNKIELNENSSPKSFSEAKGNENFQQTPCQTLEKAHEKVIEQKAVLKRPVSDYLISNSKVIRPNTDIFLFCSEIHLKISIR